MILVVCFYSCLNSSHACWLTLQCDKMVDDLLWNDTDQINSVVLTATFKSKSSLSLRTVSHYDFLRYILSNTPTISFCILPYTALKNHNNLFNYCECEPFSRIVRTLVVTITCPPIYHSKDRLGVRK